MKKRAGLLITLSFIILTLFACEKMTFSVPIGKICKKPRDYAGKQLAISGRVTDIFSMVVVKYFLIRDDTGEITVVTDRPMPLRGETIKVYGTVEEAFSLGDQQIIVFIENSSTPN